MGMLGSRKFILLSGFTNVTLALFAFLIGAAFIIFFSSISKQVPNKTGVLSESAKPPKINDDPTQKHLSVEAGPVKAVFYYGGYNASPRGGDEFMGGGNLYELYYKPTDPTFSNNLVANFQTGSNGTSGLAVGVGGLGNSQAYFLHLDPAKDPRKPICPRSDTNCVPIPRDELLSINDYVSDNNQGFFENYKVEKNTPLQNWTTVTFNFDVRARNARYRLPDGVFRNQSIYHIRKTWKISPSGNIFHLQKRTLSRNLWLAEVGFRMQWQMERGWETLRKWGHVTNLINSKSVRNSAENQAKLSSCLSGFRGNSYSDDCKAVSETVTLNLRGLAGHPVECTFSNDEPILFQPSFLILKGAPAAPDIRVIYDNNGTGFNGGGIWQTLRYASNQQQRYAYMEDCVHDRRAIGDGSFALHFGFFSSAGGSDRQSTPSQNFNLYCIDKPANGICSDHLIKLAGANKKGVFWDSFIIKLKKPASTANTTPDADDDKGYIQDYVDDLQVFSPAELQ